MHDHSDHQTNSWTHRLGIIILLAIGIWVLSQWSGSSLIDPGTPAPGWRLPLADGSGALLDLADLRGKVVVLDFWSTTCPPCLKQIPELQEIHRQMKSKDVSVIGIAAGGESLEDIAAFKARKQISYPLVVDAGRVARDYQVGSLPTLYVIDAKGNIVNGHTGYWPKAAILKAVTRSISSGYHP
ncbi:MAG: TlpA disulfide reductase family protein [Myxococcota bacterium]|nr:TlpA disulfide reductase family protein [Myxococcota bacterium]